MMPTCTKIVMHKPRGCYQTVASPEVPKLAESLNWLRHRNLSTGRRPNCKVEAHQNFLARAVIFRVSECET